jgi:hypothetical protein
MATPIRPTPILTGKDARRFAKEIANPKKVSPERRAEILQSYEWFKKAARFPL